MKFIVDSADIGQIREAYEYLVCEGVTTNPSILAKSGRNPYEVLKEIRAFIGKDADLHVQVISTDYDGIMAEAEKIASVLGKNTFIKVPVTKVGLKAIKALKAKGYGITATAIYTSAQAYLAAQAGADFVAPYVNRIYDIGNDGVAVVEQIQNILDAGNYKTKVLAASFKNVGQVTAMAEIGAYSATVQPEVLWKLINNPTVDAAVEAFKKDFETLTAKGKTMLDV
ncbi:MAG: fructose-6-phosphate aldolase [Clostridia bacterium]|nr:fructose-6-phosphate aldolase [Clostridia bacterium]